MDANLNAITEQTSATGAVKGSSGTTAQRPASPTEGYTRFNTTLNRHETYNGSTWITAVSSANTDTSDMSFVVDEDTMSSDSATKVPTQQSVKAYVDSQVQSKDDLSELSGTLDDVADGTTYVKSTNDFTDADHTKLDGIEASADVTDATNVSSAGALMTSGGTLTGDLSLGDNVKAKFGASDDLQIYHDGSNSIIKDDGTGDLKVLANQFAIKNKSDTFDLLRTNPTTGTIELYHNGSEKLSTTSTGIDVTGSVTCDGLTVDGAIVSDNTLDTHQIGKLQISYISNSNPGISSAGDQVIFYDTVTIQNSKRLQSGHQSTAGLKIAALRADTPLIFETCPTTDGNYSERLRIDSSGNVGIGTSSPAGALHIVKSGGAQLRVTTTTGGGGGECKILMGNQDSGGTNKPVIIRGVNGAFKVGTGDDWSADGGGTFLERLTVNSSGRVGIGTSSPSQKLDVSGGHIRLDDAQRIRFGGGTAAVEGSGTSNILQLITNNTERLRITSSGNVGIGTSSPAKKLDVSGEIRASSGILFGADTAAANALDDYEEGTHAVTVTPQTSGSITLSSDNDLSYTKIGNIVHVHGRITVSSVSSPTGEIHFSLPFTINSGPGRSGDTVGAAQLYSTDFANDSVMVTAYVTEGTSHFRFMGTKDNAGWDSQTVTHAANDIYVVSLTYRTT